ncbi:hypothetical protein [Microbispora sp. GKU 823]|nr:hypothetical protein [Microbispora sp. GKU 823]
MLVAADVVRLGRAVTALADAQVWERRFSEGSRRATPTARPGWSLS